MRVWLDDERDPTNPEIQARFGAHGDEVWVTTVEAAILTLEVGNVESISLDNDLGEGCAEGHKVAEWIEEQAFHGRIPPLDVFVHSANPVRAQDMRAAIVNARRFWHLT